MKVFYKKGGALLVSHGVVRQRKGPIGDILASNNHKKSGSGVSQQSEVIDSLQKKPLHELSQKLQTVVIEKPPKKRKNISFIA